jgi:hypothetical protein
MYPAKLPSSKFHDPMIQNDPVIQLNGDIMVVRRHWRLCEMQVQWGKTSQLSDPKKEGTLPVMPNLRVNTHA